MKEPAQLVFIPSPGIGHIVSTVEIAKLLVSRDDQLFITVLVKKLPHDSKGTDAYIESFSESCSSPISQRIQFINLPNVETTHSNPRPSPLEPLEDQKPHVRDIVGKLTESRSTRLAGFVVDMFCVSMIDVANEFGVPIYLFFTSGAGALGLLFELQALRDHDHKFEDCADFVGPDSELVIPNFLNPLPLAKVILGVLLEKEFGNPFLNQVKKYRETKGILVNSFMELESHVLQALLSNTKVPPVYPVGPMLKISNDDKGLGSKEAKQKSDILEWLDDQPPSSVVFLCFGSMGCFNEDQVREIARALEQAGYRFLWSLRRPPPMGKMGLPSDYEDFTEVLPQGFLERTLGIGKVIGWAPQTAVLAHPAVGGFVSHCGWNSTLESLWHGVPIATWPLYAEQQINAFELVKELGLAVEIDMSYRKDNPILVNATKIEKGIKEVMELDSDIRTRVKEMSDKCKKTLMVGGSSYSALGHFIDHI